MDTNLLMNGIPSIHLTPPLHAPILIIPLSFIENSYSQKYKDLTRLVDEYIYSSDGNIGVVLGLIITPVQYNTYSLSATLLSCYNLLLSILYSLSSTYQPPLYPLLNISIVTKSRSL